MNLSSIFLGWFLGMLSPVIVNRIYRHYKKNDLHVGVSKEINHVKERLILTLDIISHQTGSYDRDLVKWLLAHYEKVEIKNPTVLELYRMQLKASDDELQAMIFHQAKPDNTGLSLQKFPLLFISMHLTDISLFSTELQAEIFELKSRIEMLNSEITLSEKYFFMTFDSSVSSENLQIVKANLTNKYQQVESMIKRAVEQIEKINSVKKI
ncbi:hypothetical protein [uncultured Desulfuromusa sp.]|uniref:hypothetical protein n=1 Tax=uncultured Desulfuromusa sp. TaxID=219183 RepID=UPI002AA8FAE0|nr:hypothetical protein [uncultured Desulfuromusa sp.]